MKRKCLFKVSVMVMALGSMSMVAKAEEPASGIKVEATADIVSSYIWRGADCGGFSIQPCLTISSEKTGLSFDFWASAELFEGRQWANMQEFDMELSWTKNGLTVGLTDYNFCNSRYFADWNFSASGSHNLEVNLGYDFGPLALSWNTVLTGPDHRINDKGESKRCYTTYVEATAPWKFGDIEGSAFVGASLWKDEFVSFGNDGFSVINVGITATKKFFEIPFSASVIANPRSDKTFFVIGMTL